MKLYEASETKWTHEWIRWTNLKCNLNMNQWNEWMTETSGWMTYNDIQWHRKESTMEWNEWMNEMNDMNEGNHNWWTHQMTLFKWNALVNERLN